MLVKYCSSEAQPQLLSWLAFALITPLLACFPLQSIRWETKPSGWVGFHAPTPFAFHGKGRTGYRWVCFCARHLSWPQAHLNRLSSELLQQTHTWTIIRQNRDFCSASAEDLGAADASSPGESCFVEIPCVNFCGHCRVFSFFY